MDKTAQNIPVACVEGDKAKEAVARIRKAQGKIEKARRKLTPAEA